MKAAPVVLPEAGLTAASALAVAVQAGTRRQRWAVPGEPSVAAAARFMAKLGLVALVAAAAAPMPLAAPAASAAVVADRFSPARS
ncbi:hypothetical protein D3M59_10745 [Sphingomonas edaphi]|uniref:Uncharacterized protein n=1 Tax=Sphingomonas edaphi TaxID=2315689 RepID=A0A418PY78_9SPHN|nr:hypothetical protein D3M59_10745 [Sphingomonas edaphi]